MSKFKAQENLVSDEGPLPYMVEGASEHLEIFFIRALIQFLLALFP
jgi:hypothetical protein